MSHSSVKDDNIKELSTHNIRLSSQSFHPFQRVTLKELKALRKKKADERAG